MNYEVKESHSALVKFQAHTNKINCIKIIEDGKTIVSGGEDQMIRFWDCINGDLKHEIQDISSDVHSLAVYEKNGLLLAGCGDNTIKVFDLKSGRLLRCLEGHKDVVGQMEIIPRYNLLVSLDKARNLIFWNLSSWTVIPQRGSRTSVYASSFCVSSNKIFIGSDDKILMKFFKSGKTLFRIELTYEYAIYDLSDEQLSFLGYEDRERWELPDFTDLTVKSREIQITSDRKFLIAICYDRIGKQQYHYIYIIDLEAYELDSRKGIQIVEQYEPWIDAIRSLAISSCKRVFATGGEDGLISIWKYSNRSSTWYIFQRITCDESITDLAFSPDDNYVVIASTKGTISICQVIEK